MTFKSIQVVFKVTVAPKLKYRGIKIMKNIIHDTFYKKLYEIQIKCRLKAYL